MITNTIHPSAYQARKWLFLPLLLATVISVYLPLLQSREADTPGFLHLFVVGLGFLRWWQVEQGRIQLPDQFISLTLALLFLIPSTQLGGFIQLLLSLWLFCGAENNPTARSGPLIIIAASLHTLIITYLLKWFAAPVLTLDALLIANLLELTTGTGSHLGNIVYGPAEHQLLILRGCSSLTNLGCAWLAWFGIARFKGVKLSIKELAVILILTLLLAGLNIIRLYTMGIDLHWHQWWHSQTGTLSYQTLSTSLVIISIFLGIRYVGHHR